MIISCTVRYGERGIDMAQPYIALAQQIPRLRLITDFFIWAAHFTDGSAAALFPDVCVFHF